MPFDCIAINEDGNLARVSVKYRKLVNGSLAIPLKSSWADKNGSHIRKTNLNHIDGFAVYCPDNKKCYYISIKNLKNIKSSFTLRVDDSNGIHKNMNMASSFEDPCVLFAPVV